MRTKFFYQEQGMATGQEIAWVGEGDPSRLIAQTFFSPYPASCEGIKCIELVKSVISNLV